MPRSKTVMSISTLRPYCRASLGAMLCLASGLTSAMAQRHEVPKGFQQILPRGNIAAIDKPSYVPASEADIRDEAWVLGVTIDGQARAYSLDLLNAHEVVNDSIGGTNFAAVW